MQSSLAKPLVLPCGVTLNNRILKSAMTEGLADANDNATERHNRLYKAWSQGGAGVLVTGNVMVDRRFLERPGNVVIDGNGGLQQLRDWAAAGSIGGNQLWMQISHPGRQCSRAVSAHPLAPSEVQLHLFGYFGKPRAMTTADIHAAIADYARVATTARETGFTGVQIHAAHGYLISQFLSPVVNRRTDEWGGSLENRARFLLQVVDAVRKAVGSDFPVAVKLNSADFQKGAFTLEESCQVAKWLEDKGIDLLEISGGTYEQLRLAGATGDAATADEPKRTSTLKREAYFLDYAQQIRAAVGLPLAVTGGFRDRLGMQQAVADGELDVIGLGRPLCTDPDISAKLIHGSVDKTACHEDTLRLGKGWWGPNSSNATMKTLNAQAATAWYYRQLIQIAAGKPLRPELSTLRALLEHFSDETRIAIRRKRSMHRQGFVRQRVSASEPLD